MDPTPLVLGAMLGSAATLGIQRFASLRVRKALAQAAKQPHADQHRDTIEMRKRVAALEEIITDQPRQLAHEIDSLR
jgi:hypothetical protein